jgi:hypothetical protein
MFHLRSYTWGSWLRHLLWMWVRVETHLFLRMVAWWIQARRTRRTMKRMR